MLFDVDVVGGELDDFRLFDEGLELLPEDGEVLLHGAGELHDFLLLLECVLETLLQRAKELRVIVHLLPFGGELLQDALLVAYLLPDAVYPGGDAIKLLREEVLFLDEGSGLDLLLIEMDLIRLQGLDELLVFLLLPVKLAVDALDIILEALLLRDSLLVQVVLELLELLQGLEFVLDVLDLLLDLLCELVKLLPHLSQAAHLLVDVAQGRLKLPDEALLLAHEFLGLPLHVLLGHLAELQDGIGKLVLYRDDAFLLQERRPLLHHHLGHGENLGRFGDGDFLLLLYEGDEPVYPGLDDRVFQWHLASRSGFWGYKKVSMPRTVEKGRLWPGRAAETARDSRGTARMTCGIAAGQPRRVARGRPFTGRRGSPPDTR